jgi:hypothetical protein
LERAKTKWRESAGLNTSGFLSEKTSWKTRAFTVDKDFIKKTQQKLDFGGAS